MGLGARDGPLTVTLSRAVSVDLALDTEAGLLSAIAATVILVLIFYRIYAHRSLQAMDLYVISLFVAELIQGLGHAVSLKWVIEGETTSGTFCTVQGVLQQVGELGTALATLTIAVQTFVTIWWLKDPSIIITIIVVFIQWLFDILIVAIGFAVFTHPPNEYYAVPTPYWCWLGYKFSGERLGGEYVWWWIALIGSFVLYLPLFLLHLGVIKATGRWYAPAAISTPSDTMDEPAVTSNSNTGVDFHPYLDDHQEKQSPALFKESKALSRKAPELWAAILYPVLYLLIITPTSVVRWLTFHHVHIATVWTFFSGVIYSLSGVWNAVLYFLTRAWLFWPVEGKKVRSSTRPHATIPDEPYEVSIASGESA